MTNQLTNQIENMFDESEYENLKKINDLFKSTYPSYINKEDTNETNEYVYGNADDWIIVYKKTSNTKTNEDRLNIVCNMYAEYEATELIVVLIFNKFCPHDTINNVVSNPEIYSVINYNKNQIIKNDKFRLVYYKSVLVPYFKQILNRKKCNYTGFFTSWYENGLVSEKGYYVNGEKEGVWKYGSTIKNSNNYSTQIEYKDGEVININEFHNDSESKKLQLIVKPNYTYLDFILANINYVFGYIDYFIPFWKKQT